MRSTTSRLSKASTLGQAGDGAIFTALCASFVAACAIAAPTRTAVLMVTVPASAGNMPSDPLDLMVR